MAIDEMTHSTQVRGVFGQCGNDGRFQRLRAVAVEQLQEATREHAQMRAALGSAQEQWLCTGCGMMQTILCAVHTGTAFVSDQGLDMGGVFDLRATIKAARVRRDQQRAVQDTDGVKGCQHGERTPHVRVGHRVVVEIEASVGGFAYAHLDAFFGWEWVFGQPEQT